MGKRPIRALIVTLAIFIGLFAAFDLPFWMRSQPARAAAPKAQLSQELPPNSLPLPARPLTATVENYTVYLPYAAYIYPDPLGDLTSGWYLMVDDEHIAQRDVARQYFAFQKHPGNPIMRARKPWEGSAIQLYGTVYNGFRMWYSSYNSDLHSGQVLYAESRDGINWHKPTFPESLDNVLFNGAQANLVSVMHTPQDLDQPFKLAVYQNGAFWGYTSPDGIHVTPASSEPLWNGRQDVAHFSWNAAEKRYYGTVKEIAQINNVRRRSIRILTSDDFKNWTVQPDLFTPDAIDDQLSPGAFVHFYGMPVFNLGEQRLGLLWALKARDTEGLYGPVTIQLASSHDGLHWVREEGSRQPILDIGPPGSWDSGQVYTASQPIKVGSELWLYYSGCNLEHGGRLSDMVCSIGLATLPYLRLAALAGSGTVVTKPLAPDGSGLRLNYAAIQGEVRVELQRDGAPIPGYEAENCTPLTSDELNAAVSWKNQTSLPEGAFQIKFLLKDATIYAFSLRG